MRPRMRKLHTHHFFGAALEAVFCPDRPYTCAKRILNAPPRMRKATRAERRHYRDHGVVYLPGFLDEDWLKRLEAALETYLRAVGAPMARHDEEWESRRWLER